MSRRRREQPQLRATALISDGGEHLAGITRAMTAVFTRQPRIRIRRQPQIRENDARPATRQRLCGRRADAVVGTSHESDVIAKLVRGRIHFRRS